MERVRGKFTGVLNIVRFNWHFYAFAIVAAIVVLVFAGLLPEPFPIFACGLLALGFLQIVITLAASYWIYDGSPIREQGQLEDLNLPTTENFANIHAGFDETSHLLRERYPEAELEIWDFYNPDIHTEPSIRRARNAYPPNPEQRTVTPENLPAETSCIDCVFLIFALHEFRSAEGQEQLLREAHRILAPKGRVVIVEHLRDLPNLIAFSVGFFHFFSKKHWQRIFNASRFEIESETKTTPFVSTFVLRK